MNVGIIHLIEMATLLEIVRTIIASHALCKRKQLHSGLENLLLFLPDGRYWPAAPVSDALANLPDRKESAVPVRFGIASGPVVAGVVGRRKFFYNVWGDTVNLAARMQQTGEPGKIQVTSDTFALLGHNFELLRREAVEVPGKGLM